MKNNKGFTLIELLAIFVVLVIIAVITIPKISKITENARLKASQMSAQGYMDAIKKTCMTNRSDDDNYSLPEECDYDGSYLIEDGVLTKDSEEITLESNGTLPSSGYLMVSNGEVSAGCLVIGKYAVTIRKGSVTGSELGECPEYVPETDLIDSLDLTLKADGYKYFNTGMVVYYNPVTGQKCDDYVSSNSNEGVKEGCMKWYIYSIKGDIINMILDHSIIDSGVSWQSSADFDNSAALGAQLGMTNISGGEYYNNKRGPLTPLKELKNNTSNWKTSVKGDYLTYTENTSNAHYSIDYSNYKARLITAQEVFNIANEDSDYSVYVSNRSITIPRWLCNRNCMKYWTSSAAVSSSNNNSNAWYVRFTVGSTSDYSNISYDFLSGTYGSRPVISESTDVLGLIVNGG